MGQVLSIAELVGADLVLAPEELARLRMRAPNPVAESWGLGVLAEASGSAPSTLLQVLAEVMVELGLAESAAVSVLEPGGASGFCRWRAVAGQYGTKQGLTLPRDASPCGIVLDSTRALLFRRPARRFAVLQELLPAIFESLIIPLTTEGETWGAVWAVSHSSERPFDAEDVRLLTSLVRFVTQQLKLLDVPESFAVSAPSIQARSSQSATPGDGASLSAAIGPALAGNWGRPRLAPAKEGFCILEVSLDASNQPTDCRFLVVAPSFEERTGLKRALGKRIQDLLPAHESCWLELMGQVVRRGEPLKIPVQSLGLQGASTIFAARYGVEGARYVAILFIEGSGEPSSETKAPVEDRYWSLLDSLAEAFFVVEIIFDEHQRPLDFVFIEVNPAFAMHTGLYDVVGRRMREIAPNHEQHWFENFARVALTGEAARFESRAKELGERWFDVYAFRFGAAENRQVGVLSTDITVRKQIEQLVRRSHQLLEQQVEERAFDLLKANSVLQREVAQRIRAESARTELLRKLASAQEEERRRIARDLHDQTGQLLAGLALAIKSISQVEGVPAIAARRAADALRITDELSRQVHLLAVRLRPVALDDLGLSAALRQLVSEWVHATEIEVDLESGADSERLPPDVETALYRVVQESLTNVAKHARAKHVSVVVGRHGGNAVAMVEDDGRGFAPGSVGPGRLGLVGLRERVSLVGGSLDVESTRGRGTTVIARVPLSISEESS